MSIRELSLKELRALAQLRLGTKAAELKTRQELVDAIEKTEPRKVPRLIVPLAGPLPEPPPVELIELPPEPVIWTGDAPLPQITARPAEKEFPAERLVWSAQVLVDEKAGAPANSGRETVEPRQPVDPESSRGTGEPRSFAEKDTPSSLDSARDERGGSSPLSDVKFSTAIEQPEAITRHFFLAPDKPRLPVAYEDDRVLTFPRDPKTIYAAWDFSPARFDEMKARGRVVDATGATVQSFAVAGPSGGTFVEELPPGVPLKVEVLGGETVIGESAWLNLPSDPPVENAPSSVV